MSDAQEIDRIDHLLINALRVAPFPYQYVTIDCRPWWKRLFRIGAPEVGLSMKRRAAKAMAAEEERIAEERALKAELKARAEEAYKDSEFPNEPVESEYLVFADRNGLDTKKERYARIRAWWCGNDPVRERGDATVAFRRTAAQDRNLNRLADLLDPEEPEDRILRAEIARELGRFDEALNLLAAQLPERMQGAAHTIRSRCREQDAMVAEIPSEF